MDLVPGEDKGIAAEEIFASLRLLCCETSHESQRAVRKYVAWQHVAHHAITQCIEQPAMPVLLVKAPIKAAKVA